MLKLRLNIKKLGIFNTKLGCLYIDNCNLYYLINVYKNNYWHNSFIYNNFSILFD